MCLCGIFTNSDRSQARRREVDNGPYPHPYILDLILLPYQTPSLVGFASKLTDNSFP
jgi:hypothetical protein